jgi:trehalose synthase
MEQEEIRTLARAAISKDFRPTSAYVEPEIEPRGSISRITSADIWESPASRVICDRSSGYNCRQTMIETVSVPKSISLDDYAAHAHLSGAVADLRAEAKELVPHLSGRTVWMVNSTARGGGIAEMMPRIIGILRELGVDARWLVIGTDDRRFFDVTKRVHNLIHGEGTPELSADERGLYERVSRELAAELAPQIAPDDFLVVHDPQPCAVGALVKDRTGVCSLWRCHIGLDDETPQTRTGWSLLEPYVQRYDQCIFSAAEYIPSFVSGKVSVITPAIDPLQPKNRPLSVTELTGVLVNSGLEVHAEPVLRPSFDQRVQRVLPDGGLGTMANGVGLLPRPIVTQISRWDRLKGFGPLLEGFAKLKQDFRSVGGLSPRELRRLEIVRLVLAGPEPAAVQDDPEAIDVLKEIIDIYRNLQPELQQDVAVLLLPMASLEENALIVNSLQLCSTVVVQNSLREGFGLTVTEAMWKGIAVLGSNACGVRQQIRHSVDGRIIDHPEEPAAVAESLLDLLTEKAVRDRLARHGQRRVHQEFLIFTQLQRWLRVLSDTLTRTNPPPDRPSRLLVEA